MCYNFIMFEFITAKTIYIIIHLFGVAIGAGGAFMSDAMFFSSIKDRMFNKTEIRFLKLGSTMVWVGLLLLFVSGIGLFTLYPDRYMNSSKFITKMIVVVIITINGAIMHTNQIPMIIRHENKKLKSSKEFIKKQPILLVGGAISVVSWSFAIVFGALRSIPYPVINIFGFYLLVLAFAIAVAFSLRKKIFG